MKATFAVAFATAFVAFICATEAVKCPPGNDEDVTLLPNPNDCTSYYACNEGIPWLMKCPDGLNFNSELRVCDSPEHAKCATSNSSSTAPPKTTVPSSTPQASSRSTSTPLIREVPQNYGSKKPGKPTRPPGTGPTHSPTGTRPTRPSRPTTPEPTTPTGTQPTRSRSRPTHSPTGTRPTRPSRPTATSIKPTTPSPSTTANV